MTTASLSQPTEREQDNTIRRHLFSIDDLDRRDLEDLMDLTAEFAQVQKRDVPKVPALRGRTVVLAFFEDSTRTRTSFDVAARRLSADVVNFSAGSSSLKKGESLRDTIETIDAMGVDAIVVRHGSSGVPRQIAPWTSAAVINAGDGWHQHPTQALLDAFTIRQRFGALDGLHIGLCGDIQHSRVARSNMAAFVKLGARVTVIAPRTLLPPSMSPSTGSPSTGSPSTVSPSTGSPSRVSPTSQGTGGSWPVAVTSNLDAVIGELDVAYFLRIQKERLGPGLLPSDREYRALFGLTRERSQRLRADALIMHPGPMNRGVEIDPEVADDPRSAVVDQVANGVPTRMAVLFDVLGPGRFAHDGRSATPTSETPTGGTP